MVSYKAAVATCPQKGSVYNTDNFYFNAKILTEDLSGSQILLSQKKPQTGIQMYAVADGNGAVPFKDQISYMLVRGMKKFHGRIPPESMDSPRDIIAEFNKEAIVASRRKALSYDTNVFSSLAYIYINGRKIGYSNAGNVRIYRIRDGMMEILSRDHTQAQIMVDMGMLQPADALSSPQRKRLTQYFGAMPEGESFSALVKEETARAGDFYIICSCGFYEAVSPSKMLSIYSSTGNAADFVNDAFIEAIQYGAKANTTVLAVKIEEGVVLPGVNDDAVSESGYGGAEGTPKAYAADPADTFADARYTGLNTDAVRTTKVSRVGMQDTYGDETDTAGGNPPPPVNKVGAIAKNEPSGQGPRNKDEKIWPALVVFAVCLVLVIILSVYGVSIYRSNKENSGANASPSNYATYNPSRNTKAPSDETEAESTEDESYETLPYDTPENTAENTGEFLNSDDDGEGEDTPTKKPTAKPTSKTTAKATATAKSTAKASATSTAKSTAKTSPSSTAKASVTATATATAENTTEASETAESTSEASSSMEISSESPAESTPE